MPCNCVLSDSGSPPLRIVRAFASELQMCEDCYTALEMRLKEIGMKKACDLGDLLPLLYNEHWEPLRWRMGAIVCSPNHVLKPWFDDEIEDALRRIPYRPIQRELEQIWQKYKVTIEAAKEAGKCLKGVWKWGENNLDEAERVGRVMSEEQRERAFSLMILHEGKPEDFPWEDAVMAVWEEEISAMVIQAQKPSKNADSNCRQKE